MQSMIYDAHWLWRYARGFVESENGDCVAEFVKTRQYLISIRQTRNTMTSTELGDVHSIGYRAWVNETHDFVEGDRIGDENGPQYIVGSVLDNSTGQSMELNVI